ncbi:2'-5' RNA ligase family protein [Hymenobacter sp. HDW8]|uniref:2'-5' RNA ligase family protein n=1 Tax=Hymenobacter sp. HDW8 TaxID=2714932 RepID=UPI00140D4C0E|nr:2'-5' RNA ligase family protein [Hymenobacter sp. HDW8]QIL74571.1 2'-5' RNA ligase family protein [Hymenobacter sp. HDW8]
MKQEVHTLTGSRNAVRLPAHITLIPPWRQAAGAEETLRTELRDFAALEEGFSVGLQGFDWFGNRTLFVRVTEAADLQSFHADLMGWCASRLENIPLETRPFTPHMTLATRDLPPSQVPAMRQLFQARSYSATFLATSLQLFRHDGQHWLPIEDFPLKQQG